MDLKEVLDQHVFNNRTACLLLEMDSKVIVGRPVAMLYHRELLQLLLILWKMVLP